MRVERALRHRIEPAPPMSVEPEGLSLDVALPSGIEIGTAPPVLSSPPMSVEHPPPMCVESTLPLSIESAPPASVEQGRLSMDVAPFPVIMGSAVALPGGMELTPAHDVCPDLSGAALPTGITTSTVLAAQAVETNVFTYSSSAMNSFNNMCVSSSPPSLSDLRMSESFLAMVGDGLRRLGHTFLDASPEQANTCVYDNDGQAYSSTTPTAILSPSTDVRFSVSDDDVDSSGSSVTLIDPGSVSPLLSADGVCIIFGHDSVVTGYNCSSVLGSASPTTPPPSCHGHQLSLDVGLNPQQSSIDWSDDLADDLPPLPASWFTPLPQPEPVYAPTLCVASIRPIFEDNGPRPMHVIREIPLPPPNPIPARTSDALAYPPCSWLSQHANSPSLAMQPSASDGPRPDHTPTFQSASPFSRPAVSRTHQPRTPGNGPEGATSPQLAPPSALRFSASPLASSVAQQEGVSTLSHAPHTQPDDSSHASTLR